MGFFRCSEDDAWMKLLMQNYQANAIRAPRAGIVPLLMLARKDDHVEIRGELIPVIDGSNPVSLPAFHSNAVVSLSGQQTREINADLSLELTAKFLTALGVPLPGAALDAKLFGGASKLAFEVSDVRQVGVDINALGLALENRRINLDHPSVGIFCGDDPADALVITRVLTSPKFSVHTFGDSEQEVEVKIDAIKELIGDASVEVGWKATRKSSITFTGPSQVTFAFACAPLNLKPDGSFTIGFEIEPGDLRMLINGPLKVLPIDAPAIVLPGLLDLV